MTAPSLEQCIDRQISAETPAAVAALADEIRRRYGTTVSAVLYYGSCLRQGDALEGVIDLYVIVDSYAAAVSSRWRTLAYLLLPPTVKYMELGIDKGKARTKFAIISRRDFRRGTSRAWFHSYLWARFAQPCRVAYWRDEEARGFVVSCLATAVRTFVSRTLPVMPDTFDASTLWRTGLSLSYRSELRPESGSRGAELADSSAPYFAAVTHAAAPECGIVADDPSGNALHHETGAMVRRFARAGWWIRSVQGKFLSIGRWLKALMTFEGGLDYAIWKLERHTGVKVILSERARRYPLIFLWPELWRLYRQGAFR